MTSSGLGSQGPLAPSKSAAGVAHKGLDRAIERCQKYLLDSQYQDGYWWGELEANVAITSEYLMLTHFFDIGDRDRWQKIVEYLKSKQRSDGTWSVYYDGPGNLNITVEAYFAMKLAGVSPDEPYMVKAREFILSQGGLPKVRNFTKIWLALLGQWDWKATPVMPPELMWLPPFFPFNIYEFSSWARATIVPMTIILNKRPVRAVPDYARIDELMPAQAGKPSYTLRGEHGVASWQRLFVGMDGLLRLWDRVPLKPGRGRAFQKAERWILQHQESNGAWAGIQPPWVYSLLALHCQGYPLDHPVMVRGLNAFEEFALEENGTFRTQSCISPVWDTAWVVIALEESGLPPDHPGMVKAGEWLVSKQITTEGDWAVKFPGVVPGGWAFEFENDWYPDIDDAAEVIIALTKVALNDEIKEKTVQLGIDWMLGLQSSNGGWAAFDKDNVKRFITRMPFCDFGEVIDPPSVDVTAHILEILGMRGQRPENSPAVERGLRYIKDEQEYDGAWFGRWGVNYIYGIGAVLPALQAVGEDMSQPYVQRAAGWLKDHQNDDGGWGETCASYDDPSLRGQGPSTASQTAWALLGLISAGEGLSPQARRGVEYLLLTQAGDGSWDEEYFTGTGFPKDFMIKYHMYRIYFPLLALGRYRRIVLGT
ncbi:MAG: squalene--hopene cyclase [Chloroflexi bacterium]|nr:squalene--hopene cyclase [Chloroflexota bacterium]